MSVRTSLSLGVLFLALPLGAEPAFWDQATGLLAEGRISELETLSRERLATAPEDADALVMAGTAVLYGKMVLRRSDSIFRTEADPSAPPEATLTPQGIDAVASFWKKVPALDPDRTYLWGDLAQLTFRSGDSAHAVEYALQVLQAPVADPEALQAAASVFALNLDWVKASQALAKIPGNRTYLLYQGLEAWRAGKEGWRVPLKAFVDKPGPDPSGAKIAAYLIGPAMRDNETGFAEAARIEGGLASLAVRQKYVERYPNKFLPRLELARILNQFGSFAKALAHYDEIDRKALAATPEERQSVLFQQAWALQGAGRPSEAARLWEMLAGARDFYLRSAAAWFLGESSLAQGKTVEARDWWLKIADEPARSKYAYWAAEELKKLF